MSVYVYRVSYGYGFSMEPVLVVADSIRFATEQVEQMIAASFGPELPEIRNVEQLPEQLLPIGGQA